MHSRDIKDKKGFTLVEILVVIMIVGVLSMLAVGGYTSYRRAALLSLSADDIVSQIYSMRDKTIHGDYKSDRKGKIVEVLQDGGELEEIDILTTDARCFGFLYRSEGGFFLFSQEFNILKKYDSNSGSWLYTGCSSGFLAEGVLEETKLSLDDIIKVAGVQQLDKWDNISQIGDSNFMIRFSPPAGDVEYFVDGAQVSAIDLKEIVLNLKYG
ncbi:type II secretion system protein, partial [Candidatus Peregrinibacteria bacterium]|nr:type II secretion system protein [Candidatus Peregrinibacteria bacterium]